MTTSTGQIVRLDRAEDQFWASTILTGIDFPGALAVHNASGKIYWTDDEGIRRANLDGTNVETVYAGGDFGGMPSGHDLVIDELGGMMYWTSQDRVNKANMNGFGFEYVMHIPISSGDPRALALGSSMIYMAHPNGNCTSGYIFRFHKSGGQETMLWIAPDDCTEAVFDLDVLGSTLYLNDVGRDEIRTMSTNGSSPRTLVYIGPNCENIVIDPDYGKIYFNTNRDLHWVNLDGSGLEPLDTRSMPAGITHHIALSNEPYIWVLEPLGGEELLIGTQTPIRWETAYLSGNLNIEVSRNGPPGPWEIIAADTPNDGLEYWTVEGPPTSLFIVRISEAVTGEPSSISRSPIDVIEPDMNVTAPNGGELWPVGACEQMVSWIAPASVATVNIELSRTGPNGPWETLASVAADDSIYLWSATGPPSSECFIRVCDATDGSPCDSSNESFEIIKRENWALGQVYWLKSFADRGLYRTDLASGTTTLISTEVWDPREVRVDAMNGHVYWSSYGDFNSGETIIRKSDLDGAGVTIVAQIRGDIFAGIPNFTIDVAGRSLLWSQSERLIIRADLNGANPDTLVAVESGTLRDIAIDPLARDVYWTNPSSHTISVMPLDGCCPEELPAIGSGLSDTDMTYDGLRQTLILLQNNVLVLYDTSSNTSHGILLNNASAANYVALDEVSGQIYWTTDYGDIWRCDPDGGNQVLVNSCGYNKRGLDVLIEGYEAETHVGMGQTVRLGSVELIFDQIDEAGVTTMDLASVGPPPPSGYVLVGYGTPLYFDISSTATFTGMIEVCIPYSPRTLTGSEEDVRLLHFNELSLEWEDVTSLPVNTLENKVCGLTSALSPFILASTTVVDAPSVRPRKFALDHAYPNPFNPSTTIAFEVPTTTDVLLEVFDVAGRHIATLLNEERSAGSHQVVWNGLDSAGRGVSSGVYFYRMRASNFRSVRKLTLIK